MLKSAPMMMGTLKMALNVRMTNLIVIAIDACYAKVNIVEINSDPSHGT